MISGRRDLLKSVGLFGLFGAATPGKRAERGIKKAKFLCGTRHPSRPQFSGNTYRHWRF